MSPMDAWILFLFGVLAVLAVVAFWPSKKKEGQ